MTAILSLKVFWFLVGGAACRMYGFGSVIAIAAVALAVGLVEYNWPGLVPWM